MEGRGFDPRPMLDGSGVKAMPGLILHPILVHYRKIRKIQVGKWGTPNIKNELTDMATEAMWWKGHSNNT